MQRRSRSRPAGQPSRRRLPQPAARPARGAGVPHPGRGDTLRINGRATVVRDAPFFDDMIVRGNRPDLALVVDIDEVFFHCSRSVPALEGVGSPELATGVGAPTRGDRQEHRAAGGPDRDPRQYTDRIRGRHLLMSTFLVRGASTGIGRETALLLARSGHTVFAGAYGARRTGRAS